MLETSIFEKLFRKTKTIFLICLQVELVKSQFGENDEKELTPRYKQGSDSVAACCRSRQGWAHTLGIAAASSSSSGALPSFIQLAQRLVLGYVYALAIGYQGAANMNELDASLIICWSQCITSIVLNASTYSVCLSSALDFVCVVDFHGRSADAAPATRKQEIPFFYFCLSLYLSISSLPFSLWYLCHSERQTTIKDMIDSFSIFSDRGSQFQQNTKANNMSIFTAGLTVSQTSRSSQHFAVSVQCQIQDQFRFPYWKRYTRQLIWSFCKTSKRLFD